MPRNLRSLKPSRAFWKNTKRPQKQIYRNFIIELDVSIKGYLSYTYIIEKGTRSKSVSMTVRYDGKRFLGHRAVSGQCYPARNHTTPQTDPRRNWRLYDGRYYYSAGAFEPDWMVEQAARLRETKAQQARHFSQCRQVVLDTRDFETVFPEESEKAHLISHYYSNMCGGGGFFYEPKLLEQLRQMKNKSLEVEETDRLLYVLKASDDKRNYKVWFDPTHDYHIVKLKSVIQRGVIESGMASDHVEFEVKRFDKPGNVWLPMEVEVQHRYGSREKYQKSSSTIKVKKFLLNPDHDSLGSFEPAFIENGWGIQLKNIKTSNDQNKICYWQNGAVVNDTGQTILQIIPLQSD